MRFALSGYLVKADARWQQVSTFADFPVNAGRILNVNKGDLILTLSRLLLSQCFHLVGVFAESDHLLISYFFSILITSIRLPRSLLVALYCTVSWAWCQITTSLYSR
jgi:hypothetical protein